MNLSAFDLNLFVVLHTVLEERSATRAAARLNVTQSAVSNALARLRASLGDPLVVRSGRGLVATPRAEELAPLIAMAIAQLGNAVEKGMAFVPKESTRTFTVAAADNHQTSEGPRIARAFAKALPRANLRLVSADFLVASDGLASGEIDIAFTPSAAVPPGHKSEPVFDEHGCLLVRRDHPKVKSKMTPKLFSELGHIDVEVVLGKTGTGHRAMEDFWKSRGLVRRVALRVPYFTSAAIVASCTDFVAGLPSRAAETLCRALPLRVVAMPFTMPSMAISMMWHERTDRDPGARYFRKLVGDAVRGPA